MTPIKLSAPARLSLTYLFFSMLWILFSSDLAERVSEHNSETLATIETYKGLFFVALSTLLLFWLSRRIYKKLLGTLQDYKTMVNKNNAIVAATREGIYEYDIKTDRVEFNNTMMEMFALESREANNGLKFWEENIHPEDKERVLQRFANARQENLTFWREEYRIRTQEGDYKNVLHSVYVLRNAASQPVRGIGAIQDLTEFRKLQTEYHAQQLRQKTELSRSIVKAEERERNRWAEELHDNITQILSVASLYAAMLKNPAVDVKETGSKITEMIHLAVEEIRALSANLKPPRFQQLGLQDAITLLTENLKKVKEIQMDVTVDAEFEKNLTEEQKLMVYRIIQEQLHNIVKYAAATRISINGVLKGNIAEIIVRDDGVGFQPQQLKEGTGFKNMRSRLQLFDGQMQVNALPGKGCELKAVFPR